MFSNHASNNQVKVLIHIFRSLKRSYTAFQADGALWQWKRVPFGLMNAVPCFQKIVDQIIQDNECAATFAYLDNITVCGKDQAEHEKNLQRFLHVTKEHNLTFHKSKCTYLSNTIDLLGDRIHDGSLQPDPNRVKTLYELPNSDTLKAQQRVVDFFAYYAQ